MPQLVAALLVVMLYSLNATRAADLVYTASGVLQPHAKPTFGASPSTIDFSARVIYDSAGGELYPIVGDESVGYRQLRTGGIEANFGGIRVRADEYILEMFNDLPQGASGLADVVTFAFASDLESPLSRPLIVNDVAYLEGQLFLSFLWYGGRKFEHPVISELSNLTDYDTAVSLLGDRGRRYSADIFAQVEGLSQIVRSTGDFDRNNSVDGSDFLLWQRSLGSTTMLEADADGNGLVEPSDLFPWTNDFGITFEVPPSLRIPEPEAKYLLISVAMLLLAIPRLVSPRA